MNSRLIYFIIHHASQRVSASISAGLSLAVSGWSSTRGTPAFLLTTRTVRCDFTETNRKSVTGNVTSKTPCGRNGKLLFVCHRDYQWQADVRFRPVSFILSGPAPAASKLPVNDSPEPRRTRRFRRQKRSIRVRQPVRQRNARRPPERSQARDIQ